MRFAISNCEIQSLLAEKNVNLFFQPSGRRNVRVGINEILNIDVEINIIHTKLNLKYSSGFITGRVVNFIITLFRSRLGSIRLDLDTPGVIGVDLMSIPNADKVFNVLEISDLFFENESLVIEGHLK